MSDISDITLRIRVDIVNSAGLLALVSSMKKVDAATRNMRDSMDRTAKGSSVWTKAFDKVVGHLSAVERKLDAVFRAAVHMQSMGRDLLGFAKSVGGAAASLVQEWGEFEFTLNRAAAAADIFDTQSAIYDTLKQKVMETAHELRVFPVEDVAKGLYFWQSTTGEVITTQEQLVATMDRVATVMKVAALTDTSYEQAIKGVYSTLKQFNLGMEETANVSALLFFATQKTALEFPDLINSLKMTGAVAGNAKEPLESMVAVLGAIGNAGIRGSQAGRALRQTYIKIVKPTAVAKKVLDDLFKSQGGYNKVAFDSKGNFIGIEKYVTKLAESMKGLNYQQKANILATITTANELPVMTQMVAAAERAIAKGSKTWVDAFANQEQANAALAGSWANLEGSWKGVVGGLTNSVKPILLETGAAIAKVLTPSLNELNVVIWDNVPAMGAMAREIVEGFRPVVEWVGKAVNSMIKWAVANPKLVKQFAKIGGTAVIIAAVAGAVLLLVGTLTFLLANVILITVGMAPLLAIVGLVAGAITLLGVKIYQNVGNIQQAFRKFVVAFKRVFELFIFGTEGSAKGMDSFKDSIDRLATKTIERLSSALQSLTKWLDRLTPEDVQNIKDVAKALLLFVGVNKGLNMTADALSGVSRGMRGMVGAAKAATKAGTAAVNASTAAASAAISVTKGGVTGLMGLAKAIGPALLGVVGAISLPVAAIAAIIAGLVVAYTTNFLGFRDFVDGIVSWIVSNVLPFIQSVAENISGFINNVVLPALQQLATWLGETFGPVLEQLGETIGAIGEFFGVLSTKVGEALEAVSDAFKAAWDFVRGILLTFGIDIGEFSVSVAGIFTWLADAVTGIVKPWIDGIITVVKIGIETVAGIIKGVLQVIEGIFRVFTALLTGDWKGLWNGLKDIVGGVLTVIGSIISGALQFIGNIIGTGLGIIEGIFQAVFGTGPDSIYGKIKGFIGTLLQFGKDVIDGFLGGIGGSISGAIKSVTGFFGSIIKGVKDFLGIKSPATIMIDVGKNIVYGLWQGISSLFNWMVNKITNFIKNSIPGPIKDFLGISSPSKLMAGVGANIVEGLARGITTTDDALKAMKGLSYEIADVAQKASTDIGVSGGNINIERRTDSVRRIELTVDVQSSDGSIDGVEMGTLAALITGSDMTRALERMAAVD